MCPDRRSLTGGRHRSASIEALDSLARAPYDGNVALQREATIYDVAELAKVSISTVSRAINDPQRVGGDTLARVLNAIDELGYMPKAETVARARRSVGRIGVLAPFATYQSFSTRLTGVLEALGSYAYEVVLHNEESAATKKTVLEVLPLRGRLDGLIVMSVPFGESIARRLEREIPASVLIEFNDPRFDCVVIDDEEGGRLAARHLVARGHSKFCFIGEIQTSEYKSQAQQRLAGYRSELLASGYRLDSVHLVERTVDAAAEVTRQLLGRHASPLAIFAHDDLLAAGALKAAREMGKSVPDEVAIVGFDDADFAEHVGLTTIRQPLWESGKIAAEMVVRRLEDPKRGVQRVNLPLVLMQRATS